MFNSIHQSWAYGLALLTFNISNANALTSNGSDGAFNVNGEVTLHVSDGQVFNFTTINVATNSILKITGLDASQTFTMLASGDINLNIGSQINLSSNAMFEAAGSINLHGNIYNSSSTSTISLFSGTTLNGGALTLNHNTGEIINNKPVTQANGTVSISTGGFESTGFDNVSIDAGGSLYVVEDRPYSGSRDIWIYPNELNEDEGLVEFTSPSKWITLSDGQIKLADWVFSPSEPKFILLTDGNSTSEQTIFITAIPEPSNDALLLSGIALITLAKRKNVKNSRNKSLSEMKC